MATRYETGEPGDDGEAPASVADIKPLRLDVAGVEYEFRCPKLTAWAEFVVPAQSRVTEAGRDAATVGAMVMFLHAALDPEDSEELHQRKYDAADPLDAPDLVRTFQTLVQTWREQVEQIGDAAGLRLRLEAQDNRDTRRATQAARPRPRPRTARRALGDT